MYGSGIMPEERVGAYLALDVEAFAGNRAEAYRKKFYRLQQGKLSFNWCAAVFSVYWFAYRRMWGTAAVLTGVNLAITAGRTCLARLSGKLPAGTLCLLLIAFSAALVLFFLACGFLGDKVYYRRAARVMDGLGCRGRQEIEGWEIREKLRRAGGTSLAGLVVFWLVNTFVQEAAAAIINGGISC